MLVSWAGGGAQCCVMPLTVQWHWGPEEKDLAAGGVGSVHGLGVGKKGLQGQWSQGRRVAEFGFFEWWSPQAYNIKCTLLPAPKRQTLWHGSHCSAMRCCDRYWFPTLPPSQ